MRKSLGIVLAVLLVAAMSVPAMGATLSVSGKYVGAVVYDGGVVYSSNPGEPTQDYQGVDLAGLSTLYLNIDFGEGEAMSAHVPLRLYKVGDALTVDQNPDDTYLFVFKGSPFTLSLTDATEGDYAFAGFGDPLGLVATVGDDARATLKVTGQPLGVGFTGYVIAMNPTAADDPAEGIYNSSPRYAFGQATYGLPGGYTVGAVVGAKGAEYDSAVVNIEADATGPLPISEGATFTAALALDLEKAYQADTWAKQVNAFEVNLANITLGNFALSGNVRAVDPEFTGVAVDYTADESDVDVFQGRRQIQGEAVTNVNVAGQVFKLTLGDDYRVAYNGALDEKAYNKVYGSAEFSPLEPLKVTVGGFYQSYLAQSGSVADDNRKNVYGNVEYTPFDYLTVSGGLQWMGANLGDGEGSGFLLEASAEAKPVEGVLVTGNATYESGAYDFIGDNTVTSTHTRLDGEIYAEAKQSFVPGVVKQIDTTVAGLARGIKLSSSDAQSTYVGYADANIVVNDFLSNKVGVMTGNSTEEGYENSYATTLYDKLTFVVSPDSTFAVAYTYREYEDGFKGSLDAAYTVKLGDSTITLGYGASGLEDPSTADYDDGRPWAWLCTADPDGNANPDMFKLTVTIPF